MKKILLTLSIMLLLSGFSAAFAQKIAVVDVQAVVNKSAQVAELKKEQKAKMADLEKWLETVRADVNKQQTAEGKEKLLKKYNSEFAKKKETIAKEYKTKLSAIDKSITETITSKAKSLGYDMVISKSMVIMGGDDITAEVQKIVK
ncbi:MAG: OmpH family outer membrane protein [Candidatus Gastranaerophilales bacterium]|nr:OmpH family outer membrane protein [Candidatus Gastranaerophilales bacterium]